MALIYTAFDATAVSASLICNFTSPSEHNLILNKFNHIEIYSIRQEGLKLLHDVPIYGRIAIIQAFRSKSDADIDQLLVTTQKCSFCTLKYSKDRVIVTKTNGDLKNIFGKANELGQMGGIDPTCSVLCLHFLQGIVKVVPIINAAQKEMSFKDPFNVRIPELNVIAMAFLHDKPSPVIGVLWQDMQRQRKFKTYEINFKREEFVECSNPLNDCDPTASILQAVPMPLGGVLIVGERLVVYKPFVDQCAVAMEVPNISFKCITHIGKEGTRWLLGDSQGRLFLLSFVLSSGTQSVVISMHLELLGNTVVASCLSYIDKGIVFVGSISGDHQLIQLLTTRDADGSMVQILSSYQNLAPVHDFKIVDLDNLNQGHIVACCGSAKEGALKVIRHGITFTAQLSMSLNEVSIKNIWCLTTGLNVSFLIVSSALESKALLVDETAAEEVPFLPDCKETLYAANLEKDIFIHISRWHIRIIIYFGNQFVIKREWKSPSKILGIFVQGSTVAISNENGRRVSLIEISNEREIVEGPKFSFDNEISALALTLSHLLITFWNDTEIYFYDSKSLNIVSTIPYLNADFTCHSIETISSDSQEVVLMGYDDGKVQAIVMNKNYQLIESKLLSIGSFPVALKKHPVQSDSVIACCDRPMLISFNPKGTFDFRRIHFKNLTDLSSSRATNGDDLLWVCDNNSVSLCTLENQKLSIASLALNATPIRMACDRTSGAFAVLTTSPFLNQLPIPSFMLRIFDSTTLYETSAISLEHGECGQSIECITIDDCAYFAVGIGIRLNADDEEPSTGKIKLFRIVGGKKIEFVCEVQVPGCVYSIAQFDGKMFAATYRDSVGLFALVRDDTNRPLVLTQVCSRKGYIVALQVRCKGDFLIVGDLLRSANLLLYNSETRVLEEKARDFNMSTVFSLDYLTSETFIAADDYCNLFTLSRQPEPCDQIQRKKLVSQGSYHLGDLINCFSRGNLAPSTEASMVNHEKLLWFGTISGAFGFVLPLGAEHFSILNRIQAELAKCISTVGNFSHSNYRAFLNERRSIPSEGFIDGNLIDLFHSLDLTTKKRILESLEAEQIDASVAIKLIDDIQRLI